MKKVLTIAGSDSSGGAGIQADLRAFFAHGVLGATAITAVTAQNARQISGIFPLSATFVGSQIDAVMDPPAGGEKITVWKTGMLFNKDIVAIVVNRAKKYRIKKLIVDPVMVATSGRRLLEKNAIDMFKNKLLPMVFIVTPNIPEAEVLAGRKISSIEDMKEAARLLNKMGARYVVIKGGHLTPHVIARTPPRRGTWQSKKDPHGLRPQDDIVDVLFDGKKFFEFSSPRIKRNVHGTGCMFAAAIAAEIVGGKNVLEAVEAAKDYVQKILLAG